MSRFEDETGTGTPCARGELCSESAWDTMPDGTAAFLPAACTGTFCRTDEAIIGRCIARLPDVHRVLTRFGTVRMAGESVIRVPFGPGVPVRLDVDEIARLMTDAVMSWHERVAAVAGLDQVVTADWREALLGHVPGMHDEPGCCPVCVTAVEDSGGALLAGRRVHADCALWLERPRTRPDLGRSCKVLAARLTALLGLEPELMRRPCASPAALLACEIEPDLSRTAHGGQFDVYAGGAHAGHEFLRLDFLARAAMGLTPAPVTGLLGIECANLRCSERALRLADPPLHEGDTAWYSQCMACRHKMTETQFGIWASRQWSWWSGRITAEEIAERGGLDAALVSHLMAMTSAARPVLGEPAAA